MSVDDAGAAFDRERPMLARVAYRMLGSVADAEDVVQEAYLRWAAADRASVDNPAGFLRRTVTRLCLDQLKSARARRETYWGPWLPDPVVEPEETDGVTLPPDARPRTPVAARARRLPPPRRVRTKLRRGGGGDRP